jgi:proline dehydrogenase
MPQPHPPPAGVVARTYDYSSEVQCDKHVDTFLAAIATAARLPGQGFAAIKMTALGNPLLLERMSASLLEIQGLFRLCDADGSGTVSLQEYQQVRGGGAAAGLCALYAEAGARVARAGSAC